ncbi:MAG: CusA/CzcA family heavy metal efflux RND transporter, partial [bacterium]
SNVGAGIVARGSEELMVRCLGQVHDQSDLENIVVLADDGKPIYVKDVASVQVGRAFRRGVASLDGKQEVVVGGVYKVHGENSFEVIERVKERLTEIQQTLPAGVSLVPFYDQSALVNNSINTIRRALSIGLILVCLVAFVFLGSLRNALIVVMSLFFSTLLAFVMMQRYGVPGDLISFGGIAIALGMIVDATIIMVERIHTALQRKEDGGSIDQVIRGAGAEVGPPIFFAVMIIILVFAPIFSLGDVEGKMFRPLAFCVTMTMIGSLIYALVIAPVFSSLLMRRKSVTGTPEHRLASLQSHYSRLLNGFLKHRSYVLAAILALLILGGWLYSRLGQEFIPTLQEGTIQVLGHMNPNISLEEISHTARELEREILAVDEVSYVLSDIGYGEISPHVHHTNYACITVGLKPRKEWTSARTQEDVADMINTRIGEFPGVAISFSQPIQHEIDALVAGSGATVVAKVFGAEFDVLREKVAELERVLADIPGVADLRTEQFAGQTQLQIQLLDEAVARHGLAKADVQELVHNALAGEIVGQVFEGQMTSGIDIRMAEEYRDNLDLVQGLLIRTPGGYTVPLEQLATIEAVSGLRQISREDTRRYISVQCNVRGRDPGGFVKDAQEAIANSVSLPPGYRVSWGGQFELQEAANRRLAIIVPLTLLAVLVMIYGLFRSVSNVLLVVLNIPLALVGGVVALTVTGEHLSVPSSIGFIALFGIALTNGLILVSRFEQLRRSGIALKEAVVEGAKARLRPVLMTASTSALGLLPLVIATGTGSEIQRPLAIVVIGGLVSSTLLTLAVLPTLYLHLHAWQERGRIRQVAAPLKSQQTP